MTHAIPVIDLTAPNAGRRLDEAASTVGFFQLRGAAIDPAVVAAVRRAATFFFDLDLETKQSCSPPSPDSNRGYFGRGAETAAYSIDIAGAPDGFEAFNVGSWTQEPSWVEERYAGLFAANLWPALAPQQLSTFEGALSAYFDAASRLCHQLLAIFAERLGLPEMWFDAPTQTSPDTLRLLRYERFGPGEQLGFGQGPHSDYGVLTVLLAESVPGLQVLIDEHWTDVLPEEDAFVVNVGDLLAQWTNDRWVSSLHRVVPLTPSQPRIRQSVPFFQEVNPSTVITCLPGCSSASSPARYAPVVAGEHLMAKLTGPRTAKAAGATSTLAGRTVTA